MKEEQITLADGRTVCLCLNDAGGVYQVKIQTGDGSFVTLPPFKFDLTREQAKTQAQILSLSLNL